jgi:outer membrane protein
MPVTRRQQSVNASPPGFRAVARMYIVKGPMLRINRRPSILTTLATLAVLAFGGVAQAKKLTLDELLELARAASPGIQAGNAAQRAMEAQVSEARRNWFPQGDLLSILAPSPTIHCYPNATASMAMIPGTNTPTTCITTSSPEASLSNVQWDKVFTRTEIKLIQPVWDFGKISAGVQAGEAGVQALRQQQAGTRADIEMNVRKAYWALKAAREALDTLDEGSGYLEDAQKRIEKDLSEGKGGFTVIDRLRMRTARADLETRVLEAHKIADIARNGLRALLGPDAPADVDVDDEPFGPLEIKPRPVTYYENLARFERPEVLALGYALKAKYQLATLERRKEYPDIVLIGTGAIARAQTVDDPQNAFLSHYFNSTTFGVAAALRMQLDFGPKLARAARLRAEAEETDFRRAEAMGGIIFEVRRAYADMAEASGRVAALDKGAKAGKAWISAVAQNLAVGLGEARDFTDALGQFFLMRLRYLQAVADLNVAAAALTRATGAAAL